MIVLKELNLIIRLIKEKIDRVLRLSIKYGHDEITKYLKLIIK